MSNLPASFDADKFDPRPSIVFAVERLKAKLPQTVSSPDLLSYVLPSQAVENQPAVAVFKKYLQSHGKVTYNRATDSWRYKPALPIFNEADLLTYLQNQETALGISVSTLKDGWPDVVETIDKLEAQSRLLVNRQKKDNSARSIWANDPSLNSPLDQEFKDIFNGVALPTIEDTVRSLEREHLNPAGQVVVLGPEAPRKKKVKKVRRGAKITNVHMQDQFRDYSQQRPQAGN